MCANYYLLECAFFLLVPWCCDATSGDETLYPPPPSLPLLLLVSQIGFVATENVSISAIELSALSEASWALHYEKGATEQWARVVLACVLVLWLPVWLSWCYVVFYRKPDGAGFKVRRQRRFQLWNVRKGDVSCVVLFSTGLEMRKNTNIYLHTREGVISFKCVRSIFEDPFEN